MPRRIDPSEVSYQMSFEAYPHHLRVVFDEQTIAESDHAMILYETRLPPVFYFPRDAVRMDLLQPTRHHTHCPFKGNASYWTIVVGDRRAENAAWAYEEPLPELGDLKGYLAFYWSQVDAWFEDGRRITEHEADGRARANPLVDWLLRDAWSAGTTGELLGRLGRQLVAAGVPVWRLQLLVRTLHPQLFATDYRWWRPTDAVESFRLSHEVLASAELRRSPYAPILDGAGGVRRRLVDPTAALDFPILRELHDRGATDYVAMPLPFSDGQRNILSLVTDDPDGLRIEHLGLVHEVMPALSRLVEVHALRANATGLLGTYLGAHTGQRVLAGLVRRGDGERVHAVIWFSDLRDSTALTESLPRERYLEVLNQFFDCTAGAVLEQDGEVLKFIGDAVLAIFPIAADDADGRRAAARAIVAAREARRRLAEANASRAAVGEAPLDFGIALHAGHLTYGNVGTPGRLDFTVIGAAANEAARVQDLCKTTGHWILLSAPVAAGHPEDVVAVGRHPLRGVSGTQELFTLRDT
jgi:adenylate cyclase